MKQQILGSITFKKEKNILANISELGIIKHVWMCFKI